MDGTQEQQVASAVESALYGQLKSIAIKFIVSKMPVLGNAILNPVVGWIVGYAIQGVLTYADEQIYNGFVSLKTERQAQQVTKDEQAVNNEDSAANEKQLEQDANSLIKFGRI